MYIAHITLPMDYMDCLEMIISIELFAKVVEVAELLLKGLDPLPLPDVEVVQVEELGLHGLQPRDRLLETSLDCRSCFREQSILKFCLLKWKLMSCSHSQEFWVNLLT